MNNKIKWIITVIALIIIAILLGLMTGERASGEPIKIGFIGPLTGSQAVYGEGLREGFDLALSENPNLSIKGRPIQVIYEDTAGDVKNAVSAFNKLVAVDGVSAIIHAGPSQEAVTMIPLAQENQIPVYTSISQAPELTDAGDFIFRGIPEAEPIIVALAKVATEQGYKKAGILSATDNQAIVAAHEIFKREIEVAGGEVVAEERFSKGVNDFKTQLALIKQANPEVVFANALTNESAIILKQREELDMSQLFLGQGSVEDQKIIDIAGEGSEGVIFATFNGEAPESFADKIRTKYNSEPRRWNIEGYDAGVFLITALKKAKSFDNIGLREAFSQVREINGVSGKLSFDEKGNIVRPVFVKMIKDGKFLIVE